jgi:YVTN family beta-propeller protein
MDGVRSRQDRRRKMFRLAGFPAALSLLVCAGAVAAPLAAAAVPVVSATIHVGSDPQGVAVNSATGTVYVANFLSSTVSVISAKTDQVTAVIHVGSNPDGVAVNPSTGTVYVANSGSNTLSVISTSR